MATIGNTVLTLLDWAKRIDPKGKSAVVAELLSQYNEILDDMQWSEGNLPTGHRTTVRTGLPTVAWRLLNGGVVPSKSTTAQIDEQCGMLEAWSEVDVDLAKLNGDVKAFRFKEGLAFIEAMNQAMATALFYGNSGVDPEKFTGLSPRYSTISGAANGSNVVDGGGTQSDNSSMWLVGWGPNSIHGIFPNGSKAGLIHEDLGMVTVQDATGIGTGRMRAYQERWQWKAGIALEDWRYVVRIANLDISNLVANSSAADLSLLMIKALHRLPSLNAVRPVFYANRTVFEMLDIQARSAVQTGGQLSYKDVDGRPMVSFRGIPIRRVDALLETEARVV